MKSHGDPVPDGRPASISEGRRAAVRARPAYLGSLYLARAAGLPMVLFIWSCLTGRSSLSIVAWAAGMACIAVSLLLLHRSGVPFVKRSGFGHLSWRVEDPLMQKTVLVDYFTLWSSRRTL